MALYKSKMTVLGQKLSNLSLYAVKSIAMRAMAALLLAIACTSMIITISKAAALITATKTYALITDADSNGIASPGDTLEYTITISNAGSDANGVEFSDTIDANTTFVPDSLVHSPLAVTDLYPETVIGNVNVDSSMIPFSVLANDNFGIPAAVDISAYDATTVNGGSVVMTTSGTGAGQFTYNPPPGFEGTDTFTYTLTNSVGSAVGTVNIPVSGMIWFINNNASSCTTLAGGCGRLSAPFSTLAAFNALNDGVGNHPGERDNIFIYESATNYNSVTTLINGQKLIGQDATTSIATITGLTGGSSSGLMPATNSANGTSTTLTNTIKLATNSTVQGMKVNSTTNTGIFGNSVTGVTVNEVTVTSTTGTAISLLHTRGTFNIGSISSNGASKGISLVDTDGTFIVAGTNTSGSGGTIQNGTSDGIYLNAAKNVSLSYMNISNNQGSGIRADSSSGISLQNLTVISNSNAASNCSEEAQAVCEAGIYFLNMLGSGNEIANTTVSGSYEDNIHVQNFGSNNLGNLVISGSDVKNNSVSTGNVGIHILASGSSDMTASISNNSLSGNRSDSIHADAADSSHLNVTINGNMIVSGIAGGSNQGNIGIDVTAATSAQVTFVVDNNSIGTDNTFVIKKPLANTGINIYNGTNTSSNMSGVVTNNKIQNDDISNGGHNSGSGIRALNSNLSSMQVYIKGNKVRGVSLDFGILAESSGTTLAPASGRGAASFGVTNNDVSVGPMALDDIRVQARNYNSICAKITGNDTAFGGAGYFGIYARQSNTAVFNLEGGSGNLASNNPLAGSTSSFGTITSVGTNSCGSIPVAMIEHPYQLVQNQTGIIQSVAKQPHSSNRIPVVDISLVNELSTESRPSTSNFSMVTFRSSDVQIPLIISDHPLHSSDFNKGNLPKSSSADIGPVSLGTLPAGSTVILKYKVTINDPLVPLNALMVTNQGIISGSDFDSTLTDDPSASGTTDPTITQLPKPELTAVISNTVSGNTILPVGWTWDVQVDNAGGDVAKFVDGDIIFADDLPDIGLSYGSVSLTVTSGLTGTVNCGIASNTLECKASGDVQLAASGQYHITFDVTPSIAGAYTNPRTSGSCAVDPGDKVVESDDTNNSCANEVIVNTPPTFTSLASAIFPVNTAGIFTITTKAGYPVATTITLSGALPAGITFSDLGNGTATLAGTPTITGDYPFVLTVANGILPDETQNFVLTINEAASFNSDNETTFIVGDPGSFTITTTGFPLPAISYSSLPGLPTGRISLVDNGDGTATLSGTPDASDIGVYNISLTADNGIDTDATQTLIFTISQQLLITSADNTSFEVGSTGSFMVTSTGYPYPTFTETGPLPDGLTFTSGIDGTATISGKPGNGTGGVYPLIITAENGVSPKYDQTFTLTVNEAPAITSGNSTAIVTGTTGSFVITTDGYPVPFITYSSFPDLPAGISIVDNGNGTATLGWTAAVSDGGIFTINLIGNNGIGANATQTLTLTIGQPPLITNATSDSMEVGVNDTFTFTTTGYPIPTLSAIGGLPTGVTFSDNDDGTATLSGISAVGQGNVYPLTITARNGLLPEDSQNFTLTVNEAPAFTSGIIASFVTGNPGSFHITTRGYPITGITYSSNPALPGSLTLADNGDGTATLSGTPLDGEGGIYKIDLVGKNNIGEDATQTLTMTIGQSPKISSMGSVTFVEGKAGSFVITTTGSPNPAITYTGSLPTGVTLIDNGDGTALLSGIPTTGTAENFPIKIRAANGIGNPDTQDFTLIVDISAGVSQITSLPDTGDGQLVENEHTLALITRLGVVFNKGMNAIDAGNINNYILSNHAGLPVPLDDILYDNGSFTSSLSVNGGTGLPEGLYTLTVKGTIKDAIGYPIGSNFQRIFYIDRTGIREINNGISLPDGTIVMNGATLNGAVTSILVTFNEDAANPVGDNDTDDVTNSANYILVRPGLNDMFDTVTCQNGVGGDDIIVPTGPVTYSNGNGSGPYIARVVVNGGTRLENGSYRFIVCGTTSITDIAGNPLNNGSDQQIHFTVFLYSSVKSNPATGFAPGRVTLIPEQPLEKAYQSLGDLWIEIPSLGLRTSITGVPLDANNWDLTWLNKQVGWLEGTTSPTRNGNSVLTAHAYTADGLAGPFAFIKNLKYGDFVIIHSGGQKYSYKVQEKVFITASDTSWLTTQGDLSWVTLITCYQYDERTKIYAYRAVVSAVLVKVGPE